MAWSASGSAWRYFCMVWICACPIRSMTLLRSEPPVRSQDAWACRRSCMRTLKSMPDAWTAGRHAGAEGFREIGVPRIHQRIVAGSLRAERIGSQWVVDELSLLRVAERKGPDRPLSARSAWALIALAQRDEEALAALAPVERSRAVARLDRLLSLVAQPAPAEDDVRGVASALRSMFRNRAERVLRKTVAADLPGLREDVRWECVVSAAASGVASSDVDGYLAADAVEALSRAYLLMPAEEDANVVIHVVPEGQRDYRESRLRLAADLAEQRGPREELRAAELLHEVAEGPKAVSP